MEEKTQLWVDISDQLRTAEINCISSTMDFLNDLTLHRYNYITMTLTNPILTSNIK